MRRTSFIFCLLLIGLSFVSCGGGGGDSSNDFAYDACSEVGEKIVHGQHCSSGGSPIVEIDITSILGNDSGTCTGTAVSQTAVLTAAHCVDGFSDTRITTKDGSYPVVHTVVHPGFRRTPTALFNDVAIMYTAEPMPVRTYPILSSRSAFVGEEGIVTGYGEDDHGDIGNLAAGNALVSDVDNDHIMTSFTGVGSNPCFGDSGGPILLKEGDNFAIAGVVSTGLATIKDCGVGDMTTYTALVNSGTLHFLRAAVPGLVEE